MRSADLLRLFGWTRGIELLNELPAAFVTLLSNGSGIDASEAGAAAFWNVQEQVGVISAEEKGTLLALGQAQPSISPENVSRIVRPLRPEGKVDPTAIVERKGTVV